MDKWKDVELGEVAEVCLGKMLDQRKNKGNYHPYLANTNVQWGRFQLDDLRQMRFQPHEIERYGLSSGDIVMCEGGEPGRCAMWRDEAPGMMYQKALHRIRPLDGMDSRYLYYRLFESGRMGAYEPLLTGTTIKHLPRQNLLQFSFRAAPLAIQSRIADVLGKLDDRIELNRRMNRTLEKMAAAIFKSWFVDFDPVRAKAEGRDPGLPADIADLFPDALEDSELGEIPAGWAVEQLKKLADVNARSIKKDYVHSRIRYVDISSVTQGSLDQTTLYDLADAPSRAKRLVQTGDTIWSCVRPNRKAYLYIDRPADNLVVSTGFAVLTPRVIPASYLHQWVTTQAFVDYLTAYATGAAYPAVKADTFETAKMILPGKGILEAFHDLVGPLRSRIAHNQRQNRRLAGLRDTLLPKLLSGEVEVPEIDAKIEEVR